ncbi:MAG: hypothetical protein RLZZ502_1226 [Pseudomonadota bacterium]|jgi:3-deoxy-D-manno-octulosonate 8-phosphate phosphatase (KDO 8-P phosphatase)
MSLGSVRALICDVDGVLTNGQLLYHADGSESKAFNTLDGLGIKLLQQAGIAVYWLTARRSAVVKRRADELAVRLFDGADPKLAAFQVIVAESGIAPAHMAYMGDDWLDLPIMLRVGVACTVPNAAPALLAKADWVATRAGGDGAVRELAEAILTAQNQYESLLATYLS